MKIIRPGIFPAIQRHSWAGKKIFCPTCHQTIVLNDEDIIDPRFTRATCGNCFWQCSCCGNQLHIGEEI